MSENNEQLEQEYIEDYETLADNSFQLTADDAPAALEAILFAAGDPLPIEKIGMITGLDRQSLQSILTAMAERYARDRQRGLMLREVEGNWLICTKPAQTDVLQRLFQPRHRPPLSQAAYETLAIIAYNQPVTRSQVEAVRGVNSDSIFSRLLDRSLIFEAGNLEAPGRPTLFATTDQFLMDFGLRSVKDLPPMEMMMYGTLRDFEESLEEAAGRHREKQITIEQLVQSFLPDLPETKSAEKTDVQNPGRVLPDDEVLQLSEAFFGEDPESTG